MPDPHHSARGTYLLTEAGEELRGVVRALTRWGLKHVRGSYVGVVEERERKRRQRG